MVDLIGGDPPPDPPTKSTATPPEQTLPPRRDSRPRAWRPPWLRAPWLLPMLLIAFATLAGSAAVAAGVIEHRVEQRQHRDQDILASSRKATDVLVNLQHTRADNDLDTLSALSTEPFAGQLSVLRAAFHDALAQGQVDSHGSVLSAGISTVSDSDAVVLIAAEAMVSNTQTPQPEPRQYRFSMTMHNQDNRWLVSKVDFVP